MAVPTIAGKIVLPNNQPFVGTFTLYRVSGPMFNQGSCVHLAPINITTDSDGQFSTELQPGEYIVDCLRSKYRWASFSQFGVIVPEFDGEKNFEDLTRTLGTLPSPSQFGDGTGGGSGGSTPTATTSTQGKVKIAETDSDPKVPTLKTFVGTDGQDVVFCPLAGSLYVLAPEDGSYHKVLCTKQGGQFLLYADQSSVAFASLPA